MDGEKQPLEILVEALIAAAYWASGGYAVLWYTPWGLESATIGVVIGVTLYLLAALYEEAGYYVPIWLGCLLIAPVPTLWFIGIVYGGLLLLGVV